MRHINTSQTVLTISLWAVLATFTLGAGTASAKTPAGWTTAQAATFVKAHVTIPYCKAYADIAGIDTICKDNHPIGAGRAPVRPSVVRCSNATPAVPSQRYMQFKCDWEGVNNLGHGRLQVFVTGATSFRWKSI